MTGNLVFLLEEPSARDLLEGLLPRLVPEGWVFQFVTFEGKRDLEKKMTRRIQGWGTPATSFVVLRDQDSGDCHVVKKALVERCPESKRPDVMVRVACRELEAWILGDLESFAEEFKCRLAMREKNRARYTNPDVVVKPVEHLRTLEPQYQKRDGARRMGSKLLLERNASPSFRAFCQGIRRLTSPKT